VGYSWLDNASKVISGSTISSRVGSVGFWGYNATILISPVSLCAVLVIAGASSLFGTISMSDPLVDSYLVRAIVRVVTIFQILRTR
jgi:membrane glycosyltransferase